jgi:peptide/nickel transport system substrate-binding protein
VKKFRSLNYLIGVCLVCILIVSTLVLACTTKTNTSTTTTTSVSTSTVTSTSTVKTSATSTSTTAAVARSVLGCPQSVPDTSLTPKYGGTLKIIWPETITNIGEPWSQKSGSDTQASRFCMENLVGLDSKGLPIPQLASSWKLDPTNKTITFTLRQGVKFQDNTDFNADAVKWCIEKFKETRAEVKFVTSVDVVDTYTARLNFSTWDPFILKNMAVGGAGRMLSPTAAQKYGVDLPQHPVGTGPFKLVSMAPSVVKFERWEGYWQKGLPYLDGVQINIVTDSVVAIAAFTKGEADVIGNIPSTEVAGLKAKGFSIGTYVKDFSGLCGDSKNAGSPWSDINVRKGVAYGINVDPIIKAAFENTLPAVHQLAYPGRVEYDTSIAGYPYDPAKAKEYLAKAGYTTANPLNTPMIYEDKAVYTDIFTAIQSDLAKVGVNLTLQPKDNATFSTIKMGWKNAFLRWFLPGSLELTYTVGISRTLSDASVSHVSVGVTPEFTALYEKAIRENDSNQYIEYCKQLNKMAIDQYCLVVPLWLGQEYSAKASYVKDWGQWDVVPVEHTPERGWLNK